MRSATARGDIDELESSLQDISDQPLAVALRGLVDDLDYASLRKLLEM
jgi:hypothetical protein